MSTGPQALRDGVCEAYSAAAADPGAKHPFPVGKAFALSVGYPAELLDRLPAEASGCFAGVSNVSLLAPIRDGMVVLDLGCGAGLDSLIAAERSGPRGRVLGVDFSAAMLGRACAAAGQAGCGNAAFVCGSAEAIPIADASVELALVNGIFNLNPFRKAIFQELARVLKPEGQVFGAELILNAPLPDALATGSANWFS